MTNFIEKDFYTKNTCVQYCTSYIQTIYEVIRHLSVIHRMCRVLNKL